MDIKMKTHNAATEKKVLNLMLNNEELIEQCINYNLSEDDFSIERHKIIFNAIIEIYLEYNIAIADDIDIIHNHIYYDDKEDEKATIATLEKLMTLTIKGGKQINPKYLQTYIEELKSLTIVRRTIRGLQSITSVLKSTESSVQELLESAEALSSIMIEDSSASLKMNMKEAVEETVKDIVEESDIDNNIKFYLDELDEKAKLLRGYVTYIIGDSGVGKSTVLLNLADQLSANGVGCLYISPEMNVTDNTKRLISMNTNISSQKMLMPKLLKAKDWKKLENIVTDEDVISNRKIYWNADDIDVSELEQEIKKHVKLYDIDVVLIDYYQLLQFDKNSELPPSMAIPKISRALNILAKKFYANPYGKTKQVYIIALSQVIKEIMQRDNKRPRMDDMYFGGYKDARLVVSIYRDEYYNPDDTNKPGIIEYGIVKQNNGVVNEWFDYYYDCNTFKIRELTDEERSIIEDNEGYDSEDEDYDD